MLFLRQVDVIILDRLIFGIKRKKLKNIPVEQEVVFHQLFDPSTYRAAFREKKICDAFNCGLKATGRYEEILRLYEQE